MRAAPPPLPAHAPRAMSQGERFAWEERAAIAEHDGGLPREAAERLATEEIRQRRAAR